MSVHLTSAVWSESKATGTALLVLLSLADQAHDDGSCWPSVANIAARCRVSERSVHRHIDHLVELGEVVRTERKGQSSVYAVVVGSSSDLCQTGTPAKLAPLPNEAGTSANLSPTSATVGRQKRKETKNRVDAPPPKKTGTRLPDGWNPDRSVIDQMRRERPDVDLKAEHAKFTDHWRAKPGRDATKLDWNATWRNWIRNARTDGRKPPLQAVPAYAPTPAAPRESLPWTDAS